jgi:hypothetical protein
MQPFDKKRLDSLERRERLLPLLYKASFLIGFVLIIFVSNYLFEYRAAKYKNSIKTPVSGTFKSSASKRFATFCFFEIDGTEVVPIQCNSDFYYLGQKVKLTKVTKASGEYFYEIENEVHP